MRFVKLSEIVFKPKFNARFSMVIATGYFSIINIFFLYHELNITDPILYFFFGFCTLGIFFPAVTCHEMVFYEDRIVIFQYFRKKRVIQYKDLMWINQNFLHFRTGDFWIYGFDNKYELIQIFNNLIKMGYLESSFLRMKPVGKEKLIGCRTVSLIILAFIIAIILFFLPYYQFIPSTPWWLRVVIPYIFIISIIIGTIFYNYFRERNN
jgi:hypothetical protein